jgi:hypothetical protein
MDDEHENLRMKTTTNELASLVSSLNLGGEEYMQLVGEKIVGINNHVELVDLS